MLNFYAQISAPQPAVNTLMATLAALTRLSRTQIRVFAADDTWSNWAVYPSNLLATLYIKPLKVVHTLSTNTLVICTTFKWFVY